MFLYCRVWSDKPLNERPFGASITSTILRYIAISENSRLNNEINKATVEVEEPSTRQAELDAFKGILQIGRDPIQLEGVNCLKHLVSTSFRYLEINFVPRGSLIYNAEIVYAIAVYTGDDTKVAFHLKEAKEGWKSKRVPIMDEMTDKVFLALLYFILVVSLLIEVIQYESHDKTFKIFEWLNVLQKCIPISLIMLLEVINYFITYRITKEKKGSPFSHKVRRIFSSNMSSTYIPSQETSELGHVTHMILDRNTICGNHLEVIS